MQYHHSCANNSRVFDSPFQIHNREDLGQVREAMQNIDIHEWARQQRPNPKWVVMDITNATFYVTKLRDHPIGRSAGYLGTCWRTLPLCRSIVASKRDYLTRTNSVSSVVWLCTKVVTPKI